MSVAESAARAESPVDKPTTPKVRKFEDDSQRPSTKKQKLSHYDAAMFDVVNDPKGDLVVRTGAKDDVGLVRVHKAVLMMASPVFRVMLGGPWVEGSKQYDEKNPLVLDDDRTGFIDFCMLIHHQSRDERAVPLSRAVGVAVLCNKYDCTKLLAQNFSWPLLEFFGPHVEDVQLTDLKSNGLRLEDVLCISYAAGDARLFRRCAAFMISRIQGDRKMKHLKTDKDLLAMLPDGIIGKKRPDLLFGTSTDLPQTICKYFERTISTDLKPRRINLSPIFSVKPEPCLPISAATPARTSATT